MQTKPPVRPPDEAATDRQIANHSQRSATYLDMTGASSSQSAPRVAPITAPTYDDVTDASTPSTSAIQSVVGASINTGVMPYVNVSRPTTATDSRSQQRTDDGVHHSAERYESLNPADRSSETENAYITLLTSSL